MGEFNLKTLEITGKTSFASVLAPQTMKNRPLFDFSQLETLIIPLQSEPGHEKQLPEHILPHARSLRSLYMHIAQPYAVSQEDDSPGRSSLAYLTRLLLDPESP